MCIVVEYMHLSMQRWKGVSSSALWKVQYLSLDSCIPRYLGTYASARCFPAGRELPHHCRQGPDIPAFEQSVFRSRKQPAKRTAVDNQALNMASTGKDVAQG